MTWAKVDDQFHAHRKATKAWRGHPRALGLHLLAMSYCAGHLTDGLVDDEFVDEKIPQPRERQQATAALVDAELWVREDDGWRIHDWLDFNPSKADVEASRGVDRFRKELTRDHKLIAAIRERDGDVCRYCGTVVDWRDRRSKVGGTYDHVTPVSQGGQNTYDNVVVACRGCNGRKGARTPEQAAMDLLALPGSSPDLAGSSPGSSPDLAGVTNPDPTRPDPTNRTLRDAVSDVVELRARPGLEAA